MSNKNKPVQNMETGLPMLPGIASGVVEDLQPGEGVVEEGATVPVQEGNDETLLLAEQTATVSAQPFMAIVEAPLASIDPNAYIQVRERLEAKEMSRKQSIALKRLHRGLEDSGARLEDGSLVTRPAQAVRWLLEQIYNASI